jgi:hypothetical protein
LKPALAGTIVFIAGLASLFIIWAEADGMRPPSWAQMSLYVVSFPLFLFVSRQVSAMYFWELAVLNNLLWAILAAWLTRVFQGQHTER